MKNYTNLSAIFCCVATLCRSSGFYLFGPFFEKIVAKM